MKLACYIREMPSEGLWGQLASTRAMICWGLYLTKKNAQHWTHLISLQDKAMSYNLRDSPISNTEPNTGPLTLWWSDDKSDVLFIFLGPKHMIIGHPFIMDDNIIVEYSKNKSFWKLDCAWRNNIYNSKAALGFLASFSV